jgi:hypothetical protein
MCIPECTEETSVSRVKVEENGRSATFLNPKEASLLKTEFDGCVKVAGPKCDWIVSKKTVGDVLIELKGSDVSHAITQILSTAKYCKENSYSNGKLAALVVCRQYPSVDTTIQRAKARFSRDFRAPLHVKSRNSEYVFEDLL